MPSVDRFSTFPAHFGMVTEAAKLAAETMGVEQVWCFVQWSDDQTKLISASFAPAHLFDDWRDAFDRLPSGATVALYTFASSKRQASAEASASTEEAP